MRTPLADNDSLDFCLTSRAGQVGSPKNLQLITIASLVFGDGIKAWFCRHPMRFLDFLTLVSELWESPDEAPGISATRLRMPRFGQG